METLQLKTKIAGKKKDSLMDNEKKILMKIKT
jgi:hypothetical protein